MDGVNLRISALQQRLTTELTETISLCKENTKIIAQDLIEKINVQKEKTDLKNFEQPFEYSENPLSEIETLKFKYKHLDERLTKQLEKILESIPKQVILNTENEEKNNSGESNTQASEPDEKDTLSKQVDSLLFKITQTNKRIDTEFQKVYELINNKKEPKLKNQDVEKIETEVKNPTIDDLNKLLVQNCKNIISTRRLLSKLKHFNLK